MEKRTKVIFGDLRWLQLIMEGSGFMLNRATTEEMQGSNWTWDVISGSSGLQWMHMSTSIPSPEAVIKLGSD